jgi:hypothetical protein
MSERFTLLVNVFDHNFKVSDGSTFSGGLAFFSFNACRSCSRKLSMLLFFVNSDDLAGNIAFDVDANPCVLFVVADSTEKTCCCASPSLDSLPMPSQLLDSFGLLTY